MLIGPYAGQLRLRSEVNSEFNSADPLVRQRAVSARDYQKVIADFSVSAEHLSPAQKKIPMQEEVQEDGGLLIDAYPDCGDSTNHHYKGNETMYINDWKGLSPLPIAEGRNSRADHGGSDGYDNSASASVSRGAEPGLGSSANVAFVQVMHRGWPYVFVATTQAVAAGDELLIEYGNRFWQARAWWEWFESGGRASEEPPFTAKES